MVSSLRVERLHQLILPVLLVLFPYALHAENTSAWRDHSYQVVKVYDGDTVTLTDGNIKFKFRIAGEDAPEKHQALGEDSTEYLQSLIDGKSVLVEPIGKGLDMYGRVLGRLYVGPKDVGVLMIQSGMAYFYRPHCTGEATEREYGYDPVPYQEAEKVAVKANLGVWKDKSRELPCTYRKRMKARSSDLVETLER